jgi:hypothetical protein
MAFLLFTSSPPLPCEGEGEGVKWIRSYHFSPEGTNWILENYPYFCYFYCPEKEKDEIAGI